jgi:tripartite ATP-independent transporter DctM subunit
VTLDIVVLFGGLLGLLFLGAPAFLAMGGAAGIYMLLFPEKAPMLVLAQGFVQGLDSFGFAAIPFFLLAGELMNAGGVSARLIGVARAWLGHWRGGLAQANVGANVVFSGISGSAVADAAAIGATLIPAMRANGYPAGFAAALTASAAVLGPVIPPSIALILFALITDTPLMPLFLGGIGPGLLIAGALMATCWGQAARRGFPAEARMPWPERWRVTWLALPALLMPVIVLLALRGGAATASEVGAVLVAYAALLGLLVYRGLDARGALGALSAAALDSARVLVVVSCSGVFAWIMVALGMGDAVARIVGGIAEGQVATMLLIGAVLLVLGLALEPVTVLVVCAPVLLPTAVAAGVDPVHFGVALAVGSTIGLITPPVGVLIYLAAAQARAPAAEVIRELLPFIAVLSAVFAAVLTLPAVTLALPRALLPAW